MTFSAHPELAAPDILMTAVRVANFRECKNRIIYWRSVLVLD